jgi:hypothetical protein
VKGWKPCVSGPFSVLLPEVGNTNKGPYFYIEA